MIDTVGDQDSGRGVLSLPSGFSFGRRLTEVDIVPLPKF
jgi:hypothetical protein